MPAVTGVAPFRRAAERAVPGTVLYVYLGSVSGAVLEAAAGGPRQTTRAEWWLAGVGLLAALAVTAYITRIARRALQQRIPPS